MSKKKKLHERSNIVMFLFDFNPSAKRIIPSFPSLFTNNYFF